MQASRELTPYEIYIKNDGMAKAQDQHLDQIINDLEITKHHSKVINAQLEEQKPII